MMNITILGKDETKELEKTSKTMISFGKSFKKGDIDKWISIKSFAENIKEKKLHEKVKRFSSIFRYKPNYHANYENKNAVWGFSWKDDASWVLFKFIVYLSKEGLTVQLSEDFPTEKVSQFIKEFDLLVNPERLTFNLFEDSSEDRHSLE